MNERGYITLAITIMIMGIITLAVFSISFATISQFNFIKEFRKYQQSLYLSLSAKEEALYQISTGDISNSQWKELSTGSYNYEIDPLENGNYKIICKGKVDNTIRTFEGVVGLPDKYVDLNLLKKYAVYSHGDLYMEPLAKIYADDIDPTIGVSGNLIIKNNLDESNKLEVLGNIILKNKNKYIPLNIESADLPIYSVSEGDVYVDWLKDEYAENIKIYNENNIRIGEMNQENLEVLIFDKNKEVIIDGTVEGVLLFNDVSRIWLTDNSEVHGSIILFGYNQTFQMDGFLGGNLMILSTEGKFQYNGTIDYSTEIIEKLNPYLSKPIINYAIRQGSTVIEWIEQR